MFMDAIDTQDINFAMESANHDFEVDKVDLSTNTGIAVPDHVGIVNHNNGQYLGTVGRGWEPVQPKTIYEIGEELMNSTGAKINGTFSLRNGSVMGISFYLGQREYISNDPVDLNFVMTNAFDGTHSIAGHAFTYRLSCMNQCNTSNKLYSLKHTKNVMNRIEVVKEMMKYYENEIKNFDKKMTRLAGTSMNTEQAVAWFRSLFPAPKNETAENRLNNQISVFIDCLHNGRGCNIRGVKGTAYGAFQALTEYINYHRATRVHNNREEEEVRFEAIHFGSGNVLTQKGLNTLTTSFTLAEDDFIIN